MGKTEKSALLAPHAQVLKDRTAALDIHDLLGTQEKPWRPLTQEAPNFAFCQAAYWIRLSLTNSSDTTQQRLFQIASALQDYLDLYLIDPQSGAVLHHWSTGDRRVFSSRPVATPDFVFPVEISAHTQVDLYLRADTHDGLFEPLPMTLWTLEAYHQNSSSHLLGHSIYYGVLLAMLLYNLFLFFSTKERVFALYALYLSSFLLVVLVHKGLGFLYLWPDSPDLQNSLLGVGVVLVFISIAFFSNEYLQLSRLTPRIQRLLWVILGLIVLCLIPIALDRYALTWTLLMPLAVLFAVVQFSAVLYLVYHRQRQAVFYALAWTATFAAIVFYLLLMFGWVAAGFWSSYAMMIGTAVQFMLVAFGLADRINRLKNEKLALQQQALEAEQRLIADLEKKVFERTKALKEANEKLFVQSITDGLTGLYNRRRFNDDLAAASQKGSFALLIMDVDNFKPYNDLYGHQAGDETLIGVAKTLQKGLQQRGGHAYRVGGEEFAALFCATGIDDALALAEKLRQSIYDLQIPHDRNTTPYVTLSIGLIYKTADAHENDDTLYARADGALYEAKNAGRNCVKIAP